MTVGGTPKLLVDADILTKLSAFDCLDECLASVGYKVEECATLRSMAFSAGIYRPNVRKRRVGGSEVAADRLLKTLTVVPMIDDLSDSEKGLAAAITAASQVLGLAFDGGEALLASVSIFRGLPYLSTGDKKAIRSLPALVQYIDQLRGLKGKLLPLEFLIMKAVERHGLVLLMDRLESGQACDGSIRKLLAQSKGNQANFLTGLTLSLELLNQSAPGFLYLPQ